MCSARCISPFPLLRNLLSGSGDPRIVRSGFYLYNAPLRHLAKDRLGPDSFLELVRREESAIRIPRTAVRQLKNASNLGPEGLTDFVQEFFESATERRFRDIGPGGPDFAQIPEIGLDRVHHPPVFKVAICDL
jgi:hypothetical protein